MALRINNFCDTAMEMVMKELGSAIPKWKLTRKLTVRRVGGDVLVEGLDLDEHPA